MCLHSGLLCYSGDMKTNKITITDTDTADTIWLLAQAVANGEITVTKQTLSPYGTLTIEWKRTK